MGRLEDLVALNIAGVTPLSYKEKLESFGTEAAVKDSVFNGLPADKRKSVGNELDKELLLIRKNKIKVLCLHDSDYPASLRYIPDPPYVLYVKGELKKDDQLSIGVVGCRKPSVYGRINTERITGELVSAGFSIISGLARGVDTITHETAIKNGGRTVAVLGSGLLNIYPPENRKLAEDIEENGAVVSEFPLSAKPEKYNFPRRNRIISGLSLGTLITEAGEVSGALITARFALEQCREVFAIPGNIDSIMSKGANSLIKQGAKLVESYLDIIEELKGVLPEEFLNKKGQGELKSVVLTDIENKIYGILENAPKHIDELARESNVAVNAVLSTLVNLEIKGLARQYQGKMFIKCKLKTGCERKLNGKKTDHS